MTGTSSQFERLSGILAASGSVAYEWDMASDAITWFDGALDAFGLSSPDAISTGDRFKSLICPEDVAFRQQTLSLIYRGSESYELEYRVRCAGGEHSWFQDQGSAEVSATGKLLALRGVLRPLTDRKKNTGRLNFLANYDALTGQYNRNRLRESIDHALQYSQRYNVEGALLAIGIDKMTPVNLDLAMKSRIPSSWRSAAINLAPYSSIAWKRNSGSPRKKFSKLPQHDRGNPVRPDSCNGFRRRSKFSDQSPNRGRCHDQGRYRAARRQTARPGLFRHIRLHRTAAEI